MAMSAVAAESPARIRLCLSERGVWGHRRIHDSEPHGPPQMKAPASTGSGAEPVPRNRSRSSSSLLRQSRLGPQPYSVTQAVH